MPKTGEVRRCAKAEVYIFVPDVEQLKQFKHAKYWVGKQPGRIQLYNEFGKKDGKMLAFADIGQLAAILTKQFRQMWSIKRARGK